MRLCDLTDAYHSEGGGIRTYLDEKRRFLRDRTSYEHALIVPAARDFHETEGRIHLYGIASPVIPGCAPYRVLLRHRKVMDVLKQFRPDVIEMGNPYFQPRLTRRLAKDGSVLVSGFYHTDFPRAYVETPLRGILGSRAARRARKAAARYARFVHSSLDFTITASPALQRKLAWSGVPRVERISLGVDSEVFHPCRRDMEWRREHGVKDGELLCVFAGRFDREKRIDVLLDMMRELPEDFACKLLLVGQGPHRGLVERAAARDPRILLLAFERQRPAFARILASADLYVSAARFETFGLSVIEALASGLPVVGQRAGAMKDRVPPEAGVLVDSLDPAAMARAVAGVASRDREAMGRAARRVASRFTWDTTFTQLLALYEARLRGASSVLRTA